MVVETRLLESSSLGRIGARVPVGSPDLFETGQGPRPKKKCRVALIMWTWPHFSLLVVGDSILGPNMDDVLYVYDYIYIY